MSETQTKAAYYFQSYTDYFWQWEIDYMFSGTVIEDIHDFSGGINCISIPDGMTIAYKEQIEEVLQSIAPVGFPPFGAIILTFLATNTGEVRVAIDEIFSEILTQHTNFPNVDHIDFAAAQAFLQNLITLPAQYKKGNNRVDLFVFLFQTANHSLSSKYTDEILTTIKNKNFELNACSEKMDITVSALSKDINALALLHKRYPTVNALLKAWLKIEDIPIEPEDTEVEYFSEDPDLVQELIEEPKTFFMGSLIKRLWSGIQLPMHYVHPGEMPLGGISDITNKGKFDNILISEFANDDLVFLHRIANKEALFIRRETTPEEDLRTRIFLIDTTIKSWGTPKILLYATAFALVHHPKNEMSFQLYALADTFQDLKFDTKVNILEGLQITSPALDASDAIEEFINQCEEENIEITFFTAPKTLHHANIRKIFNKYHDKFGGVITADNQGNIDVYKMKSGSKRLSKHIQLPLAELWANPTCRRKNRKKSMQKAEGQNTINYPILYGFPTRGVAYFSDENCTYVLRKNGDLFKTDMRSKGFEMIRKEIRFITGIKQQKNAVLYQDELMISYLNANKELVFKTETKTYVFTGDFSAYNSVSLKNLVCYDDEIYLVTKKYYSDVPSYAKFDLYEKTYQSVVTPSAGLQKQYKNYVENQLSYFEGSVLSKITSITITTDLELIFNGKHKLETRADYIEYRMISSEEEEKLDYKYTTYVNKRKMLGEFSNGSKITIDKNGIIKFESANDEIPTFYLASYIGIKIALATEDEFAGNNYFYAGEFHQERIRVASFRLKYLNPFLQNILDS
ncbi:hypothetical protein U8527_15115 [Kordia algicida OT-1]|uniref:Uncharacterized protein n=1 Tax=Kordia algicida OT-1 TaxID=391587 RepID=A9E796_9FLAO|nr:hypothetical protein [Kordia algicida]EDP94883.1 hypothetical protein KAOT1_08719 [Kordia algicida OT-1]